MDAVARTARRGRPAWTIIAAVLVSVAAVAGVLAVFHAAPPVVRDELWSSIAPNDMTCQTAEYATVHIEVTTSDCQAIFGVEFGQNLTTWNATDQWNFSFAIDWIAEVTPGGHIVRAASPLAPFQGSANVSTSGSEVTLYDTETMNVTTATGNWTTNDTWAGTGPQWNVSHSSVGVTTMDVTWHLVNTSGTLGSNSSDRVEFQLSVLDWPWLSSSDFLGFQLGSLAAAGSHFSFSASNRTLGQSWNGNGTTFASLVFGPTANTSGPVGPTEATVVTQAGLFDLTSPGNAREAVILATFAGVSGNYTAVTYDPWVVFSPASGTGIPPPHGGGGALASWVPIAVGLTGAVAGLAGMTTVVVRAARLRREGEELVRGMRRAISDAPGDGPQLR